MMMTLRILLSILVWFQWPYGYFCKIINILIGAFQDGSFSNTSYRWTTIFVNYYKNGMKLPASRLIFHQPVQANEKETPKVHTAIPFWGQPTEWRPVLPLLMLETGYSVLFGQYHACWCPGYLGHQSISRHGIDSIGLAICTVALLWIWHFSGEHNPRYHTKCEYIFISLNSLSCHELRQK